jgi:thiamine pyrophosphokinase
MGIDVDYIVGDMDSLRDPGILGRFPEESIVRYGREKDYTDTEIGLTLLKKEGCSRNCIIGGGGGRLDHLIGILSLFEKSDGPDFWITETSVIVMIRDTRKFTELQGKTVSFFPVGVTKCTMSSTGLKWPLDSHEWYKGDVGVSNVIISHHAEVTMHSGRLIFVGELETLRGLCV